MNKTGYYLGKPNDIHNHRK